MPENMLCLTASLISLHSLCPVKGKSNLEFQMNI